MGEPIRFDVIAGGYEEPADVVRFAHAPVPEVVFGAGVAAKVGDKVRYWGCRRALVVSDPGIVAAGHADIVIGSLRQARIDCELFGGVRENPDTDDVGRCVEVARGFGCDVIIAVGGGSSLDTAKGCNFILTNGGHMRDYWGVGKATRPMLPFVAVPTTAGTGSECQSFALIIEAETRHKMACGDKKAAARLAVLDPILTLTQPQAVTARTGIDAIAHAVESAVCNKRTVISSAYSRLAFRLLDQGFEEVLENPDDLAARARMQLGSAYAGTAIENSMLGAAHSCANPLTSRYHVIHGEAVAVMLPHVVSYNRSANGTADIYDHLCPAGMEWRLLHLMKLAGLPLDLGPFGVEASELAVLGREASEQWTAQFNPRPVDAAACAELYRLAMPS
jgi:alcohol dehydrogenase